MKFKLIAVSALGALIAAPAIAEMHTDSHFNSSRDQVMEAQRQLSSLGYEVGNTDGKLGPKTKQAIRKFQKDEGLQASGSLDQETLAQLFDSESSDGGRGVASEPTEDPNLQRGGEMEQAKPSDDQPVPDDQSIPQDENAPGGKTENY